MWEMCTQPNQCIFNGKSWASISVAAIHKSLDMLPSFYLVLTFLLITHIVVRFAPQMKVKMNVWRESIHFQAWQGVKLWPSVCCCILLGLRQLEPRCRSYCTTWPLTQMHSKKSLMRWAVQSALLFVHTHFLSDNKQVPIVNSEVTSCSWKINTSQQF